MEENGALVRRFIAEVLDGQEVALIDALVTPNHVHHRSDGTVERGVAARKASVAAWHAAFPDYRHDIEDIIAHGDKVVVRYTATGTHHGRPSASERLRWSGVFIYRITDGRSAETWVQSDVLGQLGHLPASGTSAAS